MDDDDHILEKLNYKKKMQNAKTQDAPPSKIETTTRPETSNQSGAQTNTPEPHREEILKILRKTEFYRYLMESNDVNDFKHRILVLINKLGFNDYLFTLMDTYKEINGKLTSICPNFLATYYDQHFYKHDQVWKHFIKNDTPVFLSALNTYVRSAPVQTEQTSCNKALADLIESHGYSDGYIMSLPSQNGRRCLMAVYSTNVSPTNFRDQVEACKERLELLCCAIDYIGVSRFDESLAGHRGSANVKLPARPLELLKHMAANDCNLNRAAAKMNISVRTADAHIRVVKKILGVVTVTTAVFRAIKFGIIDLEESD